MPSFRFHENDCASPLPRLPMADSGACVNHVELVRKARGAEMPDSFWTDPLMYQGGSDSFPCRAIDRDRRRGPMGSISRRRSRSLPATSRWRARGAAAIRLVVLVNDVSLRNLIPAELAKGFRFFQSKPSSALSPAAVTPDRLGEAWDGNRPPAASLHDSQRPALRQADAGST